MFSLIKNDLHTNILACGDGPSSFNAEVHSNGGTVTSIDPIYQFTKGQINKKIKEVTPNILEQVKQSSNNFVWKNIKSLEDLKNIRLSAMDEFLNDYENGLKDQRYIEASLPILPFKDQQFDLVLCSHFLFLYDSFLSLDFHIQSIIEMCRIGKEVRIFPLVTLNGNTSKYISDLQGALRNDYQIDIQTVDYEFQKDAKQMMKITKA
ncbi:hypothetical protein PQO03_07665 [Lentisphaera profundi]|uniref:SAM-dependent methyltransferase n=1 Tax=Lentisphaera profundi TaxID=1658616 RepID=A0ABY7VP72_9BACT|nr:hypothetical protein [Lentisphaera profundi]WDE95596.1 hypothetical protein PQO03_07665 [Lentisphaera profundi]